MTEPNPEPTPPEGTPEEAQQEPETEPFDEDRAKAKIRKQNSENEGLRKRLKDAEAKVAEHDEATKTETQRHQEAANTAQQEAGTARSDAMRLRVALRKGLTETQAKRLVGESEEDLETDADELVKSFAPKETTTPSRRPQERLRGGGAPEEEPEETDPAKLAAKIKRR